MKYGAKPKVVRTLQVDCPEMLFYQYLPIKLQGQTDVFLEPRLNCFAQLIGIALDDFIAFFGLDRFEKSYVYLTAKRAFQKKGCSYNRPGWHSDGFMTDDINYIWSDSYPTVFNDSDFELTLDDLLSMQQMQEQAKPDRDFTYEDNTLLRLDQYNIHRVAEIVDEGMRTFVKVSISQDRYDLKGNSHNYLLDYCWDMKERTPGRNIPQSVLRGI